MELIELLTLANRAGLQVGSMACIVGIYFMLRIVVTKQNIELKNVVSSQVDKIVVAIGAHNDRLENLEKDVSTIKQQLNKE